MNLTLRTDWLGALARFGVGLKAALRSAVVRALFPAQSYTISVDKSSDLASATLLIVLRGDADKVTLAAQVMGDVLERTFEQDQ